MRYSVKYKSDDAAIIVEYDSEDSPNYFFINSAMIPKNQLPTLRSLINLLENQFDEMDRLEKD